MGSPKPLPELGILFRGDMVRAILAGQKRVTRRAVRNPDGWHLANPAGWRIGCYHTAPPHFYAEHDIECRFTPGRHLWMRETWRPWVRAWSTHVQYRADGKRGPSLGAAESDACMAVAEKNGGHWDDGRCQNPDDVKWRPSLLMPRWASRITLRVTDVRAERLTEITSEDVRLEGMVHAGLGDTPADYCRAYRAMHKLADDADPWVWRVAFDVVEVRGA